MIWFTWNKYIFTWLNKISTFSLSNIKTNVCNFFVMLYGGLILLHDSRTCWLTSGRPIIVRSPEVVQSTYTPHAYITHRSEKGIIHNRMCSTFTLQENKQFTLSRMKSYFGLVLFYSQTYLHNTNTEPQTTYISNAYF